MCINIFVLYVVGIREHIHHS